MGRIFLTILLCLFGFSMTANAKEPSVVVTIAPLHSLVQGVLGDELKATLLVTGMKSPHGFQLKPSHLAQLNRADLIFYMSAGLETFIGKVPFDKDQKTNVIALSAQKNLVVLMTREGGVWAAHDAHEESDHEEEHDHNHDHELNDDPHLWLDPQNAIGMVAAIKDALIRKFPNKAIVFKQNALTLTVRLRMLDDELLGMFTPVQDKAFVVLHDAYQYLERRYKLASVGSVQVSAGQQISAKRVKELRQIIVDRGAVCLFREPQFTDRILNVIADGSDVQIGTLDPMGSGIEAGPDHYFEMQRRLARNLVNCLAR